jgi:hypothetical protein
MGPWRWMLVNLAIAAPIAYAGAYFLSPPLGEWQASAIGFLCAVLAIEYVDHRRDIHDRRKKP